VVLPRSATGAAESPADEQSQAGAAV
jgi:hypothetical protein